MKPLLHAIVSLCIGTLDVWAEDKAPAEKPLIGISLTSFNDIITDPVKITERVAFKGKTAAIVSASPGQGGGVRSLAQLRQLLLNIRVEVITAEVSVPKAYEAFDGAGKLVDPARHAAVEALARSLVEKLS